MNTIRAGVAALAMTLIASGAAVANGGGADRNEDVYDGITKPRTQQTRPVQPERSVRDEAGAVQESSAPDEGGGLLEWLFGDSEESGQER